MAAPVYRRPPRGQRARPPTGRPTRALLTIKAVLARTDAPSVMRRDPREQPRRQLRAVDSRRLRVGVRLVHGLARASASGSATSAGTGTQTRMHDPRPRPRWVATSAAAAASSGTECGAGMPALRA